MAKRHSLDGFSPLLATARRALNCFAEETRFSDSDEARNDMSRYRTQELANIQRLHSIINVLETLGKETFNGCCD